MKLETEIRRLNDTLLWLGYNPVDGKLNYKVALYVISVSFLIVNNVFFVIYKWEDFDGRLIGIKSITNCVLLGFHTVVVVFKWDSMILSLRTIESDYYRVPYEATTERMNIVMSNRSQMAKMAFIWYYAVLVNALVGCTVPLVSLAKALLQEEIGDIKADELTLLIPFYYPENHKSLYTFFVAYVIQNCFHVIGTRYGYYGVVTSFLSLKTMECELRLLRLSVEDVDSRVFSRQELPDTRIENELDYIAMYKHDKYLLMTKSFLRYFVQHHQELYRKIENVTKAMQWFSVISNFGVSVYLCLGIFYIVKGNDVFEKVQECGICSLWLYSIYCYDYYGEQIQTEDANLRTALYGCLWTDKPLWYKKGIQLILTRMSDTIEVKPIGLFVLNLKNFAKCVNAAYSYYNLLNNVK